MKTNVIRLSATLLSMFFAFGANAQEVTAAKNTNAFFDSATKLYGFRNASQAVVIEAQFDCVPSTLDYELNPVSKDNKFGYIDQMGKTVIDFQYDYAEDFGRNNAPELALVNLGDTTWREKGARNLMGFNEGLVGFIDKSGKVVVPIKYTFIGTFGERLAPFSMSANIAKTVDGHADGLLGFMDRKGKWIVQPRYDFVQIEPVGQYFLVGKSHKYGIIDAMGKEVVKLKLSREKAAEMLKTL